MSKLHNCAKQPCSQQKPSTVSFAKVWPKDLLLWRKTSRKPEEHGNLYPGSQKTGVPLKTRQHRQSVTLSSYVPTFCHSLGAWTMEASYQSRDEQMFKTPFDVKESSEENVGRGHVETRRGIKGKPRCRTSQETSDMLRVPWLGSCPVLPSCVVRLKSNKTSLPL